MQIIRSEIRRAFSIDSFTDSPGLTEQLAAVQGIRLDSWNPPSIREALSVPAVFRAVSLISNTVGMLLMQAFRNANLLTEQPTLVARPGIVGTPRTFWRDCGYGLATRGEKILWTVDRDDEGRARKLMLLPGREVTVEWDTRLPFLKNYRWRNKELDRADVTHVTFLEDEFGLRGFGPLQQCGAALSAAVEAEEWAARFFSEGGVPQTVIKVPTRITQSEADRLKDQWLAVKGNTVRVIDTGADPAPHQINPEQAQLIESRRHSSVNVATMFGINGHLLNVAESGSSLTYQNVADVFTDFIRSCLAPGYLAPIEDAISDLLPRGTVARFNTQELLRADIKTKAEVFAAVKAAGMADDEAREVAGFDVSAELEPIPSLTPLRVEVPSA